MSKFPFPINLGGDDSQLTQWLEGLPKGSDLTHLIVPTDDRVIRFEKIEKPAQEENPKGE